MTIKLTRAEIRHALTLPPGRDLDKSLSILGGFAVKPIYSLYFLVGPNGQYGYECDTEAAAWLECPHMSADSREVAPILVQLIYPERSEVHGLMIWGLAGVEYSGIWVRVRGRKIHAEGVSPAHSLCQLTLKCALLILDECEPGENI